MTFANRWSAFAARLGTSPRQLAILLASAAYVEHESSRLHQRASVMQTRHLATGPYSGGERSGE